MRMAVKKWIRENGIGEVGRGMGWRGRVLRFKIGCPG